ncbi:hypothetical protein C8R47DRAFT_971458 [Mycena vitilis]|nr:hypothetical protein C8R47DRAFT_971458 [Mycena vitilis]
MDDLDEGAPPPPPTNVGVAAGAGSAAGDGAAPPAPTRPPTASARTGDSAAPPPPARPPTPSAPTASPAAGNDEVPTASARAATPAPVPSIDQYGWSKTLTDVYALMMEKQWGPRFSHLIDVVVAFEESQLWREGDLPRSNARPEEIGQWMKEHRKAGDYHKLKPAFGERVVAWWRSINPGFREGHDTPVGEPWPLEPKSGWTWSDWCELRESGNNGMLLVVLTLIWWGQSIVNKAASDGLGAGERALSANVSWQALLEDIIYVLECMMDESRGRSSQSRDGHGRTGASCASRGTTGCCWSC